MDQTRQSNVPARDDHYRFDEKVMEEALKTLVKERFGDENVAMEHHMCDQSQKSCPTFVVATSARHADGPPCSFRSYKCKDHNANKCFIWQAGRATSALPSFFKAIHIDNPTPGRWFIGGGIAHNNPSDIALEEARRIWVYVKRFVLVSIGTGRQESVRFINSVAKSPDSSITEQHPSKWLRTRHDPDRNDAAGVALQTIAEACVQLSHSAEATHQQIFKGANTQDPDGGFPYFRFNVERDMHDIGFHEWYKLAEIGDHTTRYLDEEEGRTKLEQCAKILIRPPIVECKSPKITDS
jgi:predicted acylesterase/phospholipase RssA